MSLRGTDWNTYAGQRNFVLVPWQSPEREPRGCSVLIAMNSFIYKQTLTECSFFREKFVWAAFHKPGIHLQSTCNTLPQSFWRVRGLGRGELFVKSSPLPIAKLTPNCIEFAYLAMLLYPYIPVLLRGIYFNLPVCWVLSGFSPFFIFAFRLGVCITEGNLTSTRKNSFSQYISLSG